MKDEVSINDFVLTISEEQPFLAGGRCKNCGNHTFPIMPGCPKCASTDIEKVRLGSKGTLWAWTVQAFPPKSPPYLGENDPDKFRSFGVGYVELPELIIETRLTENEPAKLSEGMEMELQLEHLYTNDRGEKVMTYAFSPIE